MLNKDEEYTVILCTTLTTFSVGLKFLKITCWGNKGKAQNCIYVNIFWLYFKITSMCIYAKLKRMEGDLHVWVAKIIVYYYFLQNTLPYFPRCLQMNRYSFNNKNLKFILKKKGWWGRDNWSKFVTFIKLQPLSLYKMKKIFLSLR